MNYVTNIIIDPMKQVVTGRRERKVVIMMPDAMNSSPTIFPVDKSPKQFWSGGAS